MAWKDKAASMVRVSYPFIQWINDGGILNPRARTGGFAMPESEASVANDWPKGATKLQARFKGGDEDVFFSSSIRIAVIAVRFAWTKDGIPVPEYVDGARGKVRALVLVEGEKGPFWASLTLTGLASRDFLLAWKGHRARVRKATRAAGQEAPASLFYMTIRAGEAQKMAQGSIRTPMYAEEALDLDRDYIGDQAVDMMAEKVRAWEQVNGNGEPEPDAPEVNGHGNGDEPEETGPTGPDQPLPSPEVLQWALSYPCPFRGKSFAAGTPLKDLPDEALRYLERQIRFPEAARAASLVLLQREAKGDIPF